MDKTQWQFSWRNEQPQLHRIPFQHGAGEKESPYESVRLFRQTLDLCQKVRSRIVLFRLLPKYCQRVREWRVPHQRNGKTKRNRGNHPECDGKGESKHYLGRRGRGELRQPKGNRVREEKFSIVLDSLVMGLNFFKINSYDRENLQHETFWK